MTLAVFLAVLAAAAMHAIWNAAIKTRLDRFASISLLTFGMGLAALPTLPFVDMPPAPVWIWIVLSVLLHTGYRLALIKAYETGDLAQIYPLARGSAPLLTALGSLVIIQETPSLVAMGGIVLLCCGTLLMSMRGSAGAALTGSTIFFALTTSACIAGYTLTDGVGARAASSASSYAAWLFVCDGIVTMAACLAVRGRGVVATLLPEWRVGLVAGLLAAAAYWIVMWAMTRAPIASVAALRETSILFAMAIAVIGLRETITGWRIAASLLIVAGIIALRLG